VQFFEHLYLGNHKRYRKTEETLFFFSFQIAELTKEGRMTQPFAVIFYILVKTIKSGN